MRKAAIQCAALFLVLAVAGCVEDSAPAQVASTTAAAAAVSSDTGSISGVVTDEELVPLMGSDVAVQSGPAAKTDGLGKFTFNDLAPGTYNIVAQRLGYEAVAKRVDVAVGQIVEVTLVLKALAVVEERSETLILNGFYEYGVFTPAVVSRPYKKGADYFETNVTDGANLKTVIDEMTWDSTAPLTAKRFQLIISADGSTQAHATSKSPVVVRADEPKVKKSGSILRHTTWNYPTGTDDPTGMVGLVYQQKFTIYFTSFWGKEAPEDFQARP